MRRLQDDKHHLSVLVLLQVPAVPCRTMPPPLPDDAAAQIRALGESWLAATARRDLDGMMSIYAPDAQEMLPDMPPLVGPDAIRAFYQALIEKLPRFAHYFAPEDITVAGSGDFAVVRGSYRFTPDTLVPKQVLVGKYVGVWRWRDGEWRLFINISNSNEVAAPSV